MGRVQNWFPLTFEKHKKNYMPLDGEAGRYVKESEIRERRNYKEGQS